MGYAEAHSIIINRTVYHAHWFPWWGSPTDQDSPWLFIPSPKHIIVTPHEIVREGLTVEFKHLYYGILQIDLSFFR